MRAALRQLPRIARGIPPCIEGGTKRQRRIPIGVVSILTVRVAKTRLAKRRSVDPVEGPIMRSGHMFSMGIQSFRVA